MLPLLKRLVLLFQTNQPVIHTMHDEQISLVKRFLCCYVKPQYKDLLPENLASFEIQKNILLKNVFFGQSLEKIMTKRNESKMCF